MAQLLEIHPRDPQLRLVGQAAEVVRGGGLVVYPTDSCYAFGCHLGDKQAVERMRRIRRMDDSHEFSIVCRDLSELAVYARVDNPAFRLLKALTPGPYTFVLKATREVPRRLVSPRRRTIGVRVPDHPIAQSLLGALGEPMMSTTLILPGSDLPLTDPEEIRRALRGQVDLVVDGGPGGLEPTTVVDLTGTTPRVLRQGIGNLGGWIG